MLPVVRETLLAMGQNIRVYAVQPLSTYIDQSLTAVRWMVMALSGFGLLALVLAAVGVYGVIAYRVSLTQEIGVRVALGAARGAIFRDVVLHGLKIAIAGVVIGEVLAVPAIRALASVQAGIRPGTPSTHVGGCHLGGGRPCRLLRARQSCVQGGSHGSPAARVRWRFTTPQAVDNSSRLGAGLGHRARHPHRPVRSCLPTRRVFMGYR
jgi:hypothetical protein